MHKTFYYARVSTREQNLGTVKIYAQNYLQAPTE